MDEHDTPEPPDMHDMDETHGTDDVPEGDRTNEMDDATETPDPTHADDDIATNESFDDPSHRTDLRTPPPTPEYRQSGLVRDPYATFGGVMSGIAHRYGWDVSLTRLGFLATVFLTAGSALLLYLLAWLIVPRATYWPPNGPIRSGAGLSNRELGFGLAGAGILIFLAVGSGPFGAAIVPLALIGGGLFLLLQAPRVEEPSMAAPTMAPVGSPAAAAPPPTDAYGTAPPPAPPSPVGQPVPPRKRRRRWVVAIAVALLAALAAIAALIAGLVIAASNADISIDAERHVTITPMRVEDFPYSINEDAAEVEVDLTFLSDDDFSGLVDPVEVDVRVDVGTIRVIVPHDLAVTVAARNNIGNIDLDGESASGFNSEATITDDDPSVALDLDLDVGEIRVVRRDGVRSVIER